MSTPRLWTPEWKRTRRAFAATLPAPCAKCGGVIAAGAPFHLGHKTPRSKGGGNNLGNLQVEHPRCNLAEAPRLGWESTLRRRRANAARASTAARWGEPSAGGYRVAAVEAVERSRIY
jgi:5-methylcytosine-specific restriction endonuclease McrA